MCIHSQLCMYVRTYLHLSLCLYTDSFLGRCLLHGFGFREGCLCPPKKRPGGPTVKPRSPWRAGGRSSRSSRRGPGPPPTLKAAESSILRPAWGGKSQDAHEVAADSRHRHGLQKGNTPASELLLSRSKCSVSSQSLGPKTHEKASCRSIGRFCVDEPASGATYVTTCGLLLSPSTM